MAHPACRNLEGSCLDADMHLVETDRVRAAVHEAGHALIATSRGVAVASIELHGDDGAGGARLAHEPSSELDRLWILHGGPRAEEVIFGNCAPTGISSDFDDIWLAFELAGKLKVSNSDTMQRVHQFLWEHRVGLNLVACRLLEADILEGSELDRLLREGLTRR